MHIVKPGGVKELTRQTGGFQEPALCLIDGLRAINRMQLGQACALAHTSPVLLCFLFQHGSSSWAGCRAGVQDVAPLVTSVPR